MTASVPGPVVSDARSRRRCKRSGAGQPLEPGSERLERGTQDLRHDDVRRQPGAGLEPGLGARVAQAADEVDAAPRPPRSMTRIALARRPASAPR